MSKIHFYETPFLGIFPLLMGVISVSVNATEHTMTTDSSTEVKLISDGEGVSLEVTQLKLAGKRTYEVKVACPTRDQEECMNDFGSRITQVENPDADTREPYLTVYLSPYSDVTTQLFDSVSTAKLFQFERSESTGDLKEISGKHYLGVSLSKENIRDVKFLSKELKFSITFESYARYSKVGFVVACTSMSECLQSKRVIEKFRAKSAELIFETTGKYSQFLGERVSVTAADGSLKTFSRFWKHPKYKSLGESVTRDDSTGLVWGSKVKKDAKNSTVCDSTIGPDCWMTREQAGEYCLRLNGDVAVIQSIGNAFKNNENPKKGIYLPSYSEYYQLAVNEGYHAHASKNRYQNFPIEQDFYPHMNRDYTYGSIKTWTSPAHTSSVEVFMDLNIEFSSDRAKNGLDPQIKISSTTLGPFMCVGRF